MCTQPNKLADNSMVACRRCWQCKANKVKDWSGRCIAESRTAIASHAITLTYGRVDGEKDHQQSSVLTYSDVQAFLKRLRSNKYPVRYLVAGEYGSLNGRAHWHMIIFWQKKVHPAIKEGTIHLPEWPHGHVNVQKLAYEAITYCVKYLTKDTEDEGAQAHFSLSKKPPLGDAFFKEWADRHVMAGIAPRSEIYSFDDNRDKSGKKREFFMQGVTRKNFCKYFIEKWQETYPERHLPNSEFIERYLDEKQREINEREDTAIGLYDPYAIKTIGFPKAAPDGISKIITPNHAGLIKSHCMGETWFWVPDESGVGIWQSETDRRIKEENRQRLLKSV